MPGRHLTYFASDVHLGLDVNDAPGRERRFADFLNSIPREETEALYLLGDVWDFWYEYHDVVPKGYVRVFASIMDLVESGVKVYFFQGNHGIWCYHYFDSLGMIILQQPHLSVIGGKTFCLGHGDGLGPGNKLYKLMRWGFRAKFFQSLFSLLHPWLAFRLGKNWSKHSRLAKSMAYEFRGSDEPLYKWSLSFAASSKAAGRPVDYFIFGHYHCHVDMTLPGGERLLVLRDWMKASPYLRFDSVSGAMDYQDFSLN